MKRIIYSPGEPAGIGPDLIIKIASSQSWENFKIPIVSIGDPSLFLERAKLLNKKIEVIQIDSVINSKPNRRGFLHVIKTIKCKKTAPGKLHKLNGEYVLNNLNYAIKETIKNQKSALVTGPLSKENVISLDKSFSGHTEYIQKITKSNDVLMMLASDKLKVALATTHIPLKLSLIHI